MRGILGRSFLALTAIGLALAAAPAAASAAGRVQDPIPIEPNQYFTGLINGHPPGHVVIRVACGPSSKTGSPLGNQPVEVEPAPSSAAADLGYTGSKGRSITAGLSTSPAVAIGSFTSFYVKEDIPTNIVVPCAGAGTVLFAPDHGGKKAHAATLHVTFVNIAPTGSGTR
jgi:hypothetical protein